MERYVAIKSETKFTMMGLKIRAPLIFTLGILGTLIFCGLGAWQMHRSHWKNKIIHQMNAAVHLPPVSLQEILKNPEAFLFRKVALKGMWGKGPNLFMKGIIFKQNSGYHLLNILTLETGQYLLVNFGWVDHKNVIQKGIFPAELVGRVRMNDAPFAQRHAPDLLEWESIDTHDIGTALGIHLLPFYVDYVHEDEGHPPYPIPDLLVIENNHLGYALTWFALAMIWGTTYGILFFRSYGALGRNQ